MCSTETPEGDSSRVGVMTALYVVRDDSGRTTSNSEDHLVGVQTHLNVLLANVKS